MDNSLKSFRKIDALNSIPEILSILAKLVNLKSFNHTYLIITKNMYKMIQDKNFKNSSVVGQLISNFVKAYLKAVKLHQNKQSVSTAWEVAFKFCEERQTNHLLYLAIGANAHINDDLAFVLEKTIKNEDFYSDYQKIGEAIELSLNEVILSINSESSVLRFIDKNLFWMYKLIIKFLLKEWRKVAWNNYVKLKQREKIESQIKTASEKKAYAIFAIACVVPH